MPKREIIAVNDDPEESAEFVLDYADEWRVEEMEEGVEVIREPEASLEELANFCDKEAEGRGRTNHAFVGAHRMLAAILHQKLGREQATVLMKEIAEYGGLDGMSGVGGEVSAYEEFGIADCWADWSLPE